MSGGKVLRIFNATLRNRGPICQIRRYYERRRRKGDGTKTDIFEEKGAASQEEYFRKETARQLKKLRLNLEKSDELKKAKKDGEEKKKSSLNKTKK